MKTLITLMLLMSFFGCAHRELDEGTSHNFTDAVALKKPRFERCYAFFGEGKAVEVVIRYETNFAGGLRLSEIDRSEVHFAPPKFEECILTEFRAVQFPQSTNGIYGRERFKFGH